MATAQPRERKVMCSICRRNPIGQRSVCDRCEERFPIIARPAR